MLTTTPFVPVAKTGQTPVKGAKTAAQKTQLKKGQAGKTTTQVQKQKAKKTVEVQKKKTGETRQAAKQNVGIREVPKVPRPLTDEEKIIQAAERYHQQLSGKKPVQSPEQATVNPAPVPASQAVPSQPIAEKPVADSSQVVNQVNWSVPAGASYIEHVPGAEREPDVNIYSGNPGIYQADDDTLNFWGYTPLAPDTLAGKLTALQQPAKPYGFAGNPVKSTSQDWPFFLVILGWAVFASLRFGFSRYIGQVFQGIVNFTAASRLYREKGYSSNFGVFRLNIIFFLFLPFPVYLIAKDNGVSIMNFSGIELYLIIFVVVNAYFMLKIFLYKILGSVFSRSETTGELIFNMMLYHNVLGLILLPVSTIHYLVPGFGVASLFLVPGLIVIFYLMTLVRSVYFAVREGISIFYLILYLCALEILPVLLVIKLAMGD